MAVIYNLFYRPDFMSLTLFASQERKCVAADIIVLEVFQIFSQFISFIFTKDKLFLKFLARNMSDLHDSHTLQSD